MPIAGSRPLATRMPTSDGLPDVGPAGEWLLDNYHVVQEHIREVRESLPRGYYRELPELAAGALAGYPRVYELAITLIAHTEGRVDLDNVTNFVQAFQQVSPLTIGELWAIPAMLRLGLIENVRRMALRTVQRLDEVERGRRCGGAHCAGRERRETAALDAELDRFAANPPPLTPDLRLALPAAAPARGGALPAVGSARAVDRRGGLSAEEAAARATQRSRSRR